MKIKTSTVLKCDGAGDGNGCPSEIEVAFSKPGDIYRAARAAGWRRRHGNRNRVEKYTRLAFTYRVASNEDYEVLQLNPQEEVWHRAEWSDVCPNCLRAPVMTYVHDYTTSNTALLRAYATHRLARVAKSASPYWLNKLVHNEEIFNTLVEPEYIERWEKTHGQI